jgi:hypothetical protein
MGHTVRTTGEIIRKSRRQRQQRGLFPKAIILAFAAWIDLK